jgi:hypothetical protein
MLEQQPIQDNQIPDQTSIRHYVSYCVMDTEAGANPFWHACLILSTQKHPEGPIHVDDAIGFYSQPSTTTNPLTKAAKHVLGFKIDLQDSHGVLKQEKMRDLDGNGLHEISFSITKEQYEALRASYKEQMAIEKKAIEELNKDLREAGLPENAYTRYIRERSLAEKENRPPRLKPFHIAMGLTPKGLDSTKSHACKNAALESLVESQIIDEVLRERITGNKLEHAFPRFGQGKLLKPARLVSTGDPEAHESQKSNKVYYNRSWEKNRLYWATSPHLYHTNEPTTATPETNTTPDPYPYVKKMLTRVRHIETKLRHQICELESPPNIGQHKQHLLEQLQRVQGLYDLFSNAYENHLPKCLNEKLWRAETTLNVATMTMTPHRVNSSFMLRAYESIAVRHALLSLLCLAVAAAFASTVVGAVIMTTAGLFAGQQLYRFFKE